MSPICLLGFGEVGQTLAADLHERGHQDVTAWDTLFVDSRSSPSRAAAAGRVNAAVNIHDALSQAGLVICAVTADQCIEAARSAAAHLTPHAWFVDLNSVAPQTKLQAADLIDSHGGRYIEAAVMAPIGPQRIATSMLLGGSHAQAFQPLAHTLGFTGARTFSSDIGKASAAKMCRSVMVKGMEALLAESLLAARRYGVEDTVLDSLANLFPGMDWPTLGRYMISRSLQHGHRRAEEMREAATAVRDTGIEPHMCLAIANRQDWAGTYLQSAGIEPLAPMLDSILATIADPRGTSC